MDVQNVISTESDVQGTSLNDVACHTVNELKRWLQCHGLKITGKKEELITRFDFAILSDIQVDPKVDGGKWHAAKKLTDTSTKAF